ncbi:L,D-transpeptidase scaffold domain-containing protein, partial [Paracoccus binzhouensis]
MIVVTLLAAAPRPAGAQALDVVPVAALPAPRLAFSQQEMALASRVAGNPGLADFYGTNGLQPIFLGPQGARHRAALIEAVGQAASHGLPASRYQQAALRRLDREGADSVEAELRFARVFALWSHDVSGGILDPRKVESGIKREVRRPRTGDLMRDFARAADPGAVLAALPPRDPRYRALRDALARQSRL